MNNGYKHFSIVCFIAIVITQLSTFNVNAQGVGINLSGNPPDPSAILDVSSHTKGVLISRMTTAERDAITSPAEGLLLFNTTTRCFESYVYGSWNVVSCPCPSIATPTAGPLTPSATQIVWSWNTVSGASGYKYNSVNDYASASDNSTSTSYTQTGLTCNTSYMLYVWAYSSCANSIASTLTQMTSACVCTTSPCGTQIFMCTNINVGTQINNSQTMSAPGGNEKYCYNDVASNCTNYGGLYNWNEAMNYTASANCDPCGAGGVQGICPSGYHVPTDLEWSRYEWCIENNLTPIGNTSLATFQNGFNVWRGSSTSSGPGTKMKDDVTWDGSNTSGFTFLPGGYSWPGGNFGIGNDNSFWTATEYDATNAYNQGLSRGQSNVWRSYTDKGGGFYSVRCIKD